MARYDFEGFALEVNEAAKKPVAVFASSCTLNALYRTTSLDEAMRFVNAYRAGEAWATEAVAEERRNWRG